MTDSELKTLFRLDTAIVAGKLAELLARGLLAYRTAAVYKIAAGGTLPGNGRLAQFGVNERAELILLIDAVEDAFRKTFPEVLAEGCG